MSHLLPCPRRQYHVNVGDAACPFCQQTMPADEASVRAAEQRRPQTWARHFAFAVGFNLFMALSVFPQSDAWGWGQPAYDRGTGAAIGAAATTMSATGVPATHTTSAPGSPPGASVAPHGSSVLASDGRRLMRDGHFREAAEKLKQAAATASTTTKLAGPIDSEVWFDLGHCLERLGRDDEAVDSYRKYKLLPLTLRVNEAEERIQAIERRKNPPSATNEPKTPVRHVLVPTAADQGRCASECLEASTCWRFPGDSTNARFHCARAQFSCLRSCSGARVQGGICPTTRPRENIRCVQDQTSLFGPGFLSPRR